MSDFLISRGFVNKSNQGKDAGVMARLFGDLALAIDTQRWVLCNQHIVQYGGGSWDLYLKDSTPVFILTGNEDVTLVCQGNYFKDSMSREAAGLAITASLYNFMCWRLHDACRGKDSDKFSMLYYEVKELISEHPESAKIYQFLD